MDKNFIAARIYKKIIQKIPIACVDVVLVCKRNFLLCKRKNQPAKGKWWLIGGRIFKNEKIKNAVMRHIRQEATIKRVKKIKLLGIDETIFKKGPFGGGIHTINLVFLAETDEENKKDAGDDGELRWFSKINHSWPKYVVKFLKKARFQ